VCATTVDNSGVYVYYLKGIVPICFRCPARTVGFSGTRLYLCKPTKLSDAQALPTPWLGRSIRGLQRGGHVHKETVHLLSLQPASITSSGTFKPECNGLSQFRQDTGRPSMPVREFNFIACPLVQSSSKTPYRPGFEPRPVRAISPSGQQALWPIQWPRPKKIKVERKPTTVDVNMQRHSLP